MHQVIPPSLGGSVKRQAQNCSQGMWQGVCTSGTGVTASSRRSLATCRGGAGLRGARPRGLGELR